MTAVLTLAGLTVKEAVRRRIAAAAIVLGIAFLALFNVGVHFIIEKESEHRGMQPGFLREAGNFLFMAGMYAANLLVIAIAALIAADSVAGEIDSGRMQTIVSKPIRRGAVIGGKWTGLALLIGVYLLLLGGGLVASVRIQTGFAPPRVERGMALMFLEGLIMMTATLAASTRFSTLATGGTVFGLFGLAFVGGWVEQIGAFMESETAVRVGVASSLLFPTDALWRRASHEMTSELGRVIAVSPFTPWSVPSAMMILYGAVYGAATLLLAWRLFLRRDL